MTTFRNPLNNIDAKQKWDAKKNIETNTLRQVGQKKLNLEGLAVQRNK